MSAGARFFRTGAAFRTWLAKQHATSAELLMGFYKTNSGKGGITYKEALDEALAYGWIDGIRTRIDDDSYSIRFTPRRARSIWSAVNMKRVKELVAEDRMAPAGMEAFARRDEKRSAIYSYERGGAVLSGVELETLQANAKAWTHYEAQAPYYKRTIAFWIVSARKPETRARRVAILIAHSQRGERIDTLASSRLKTPSKGKSSATSA